MPSIPEQYQSSKAMQFVVSQGWNWRPVSAPKIEIEVCPYCQNDGWHAVMEIHAADDEEKNRDGLHSCVRCAKGGNLQGLKQKLGMAIAGVEGKKDWAGNAKEVDPLPDTDALHDALMADEAALDYLVNGRGFSLDIIQKQKLGLKEKHFFRETGEVRALVYPYLVNGNTVWAHYRTLPTMPLADNKVIKAFSSPSGWDSTLYNGAVLLPGITDLVMVEGEPNVIAALDHGIVNIVGVPGANIKKAGWIETLDTLGLDKIYICYDKDKVGQRAAQALASRIGIERCWKIVLPDFDVTTEDGTIRPGKDLNEWFVSGGGTKEAFDLLKQGATLFDVEGVSGTGESVQEFLDELKDKGSAEPKYKSPWEGLNKWVGFDDADVIDILAPEKVGKTTFALNLVEHMVDTYGDDGVIICLEMSRAKMARKWICHKAQIADNIPQNEIEATELYEAFMQAIPKVQDIAANREGELYFCYPQYKTMEDLYGIIRQIIRRYGVKWIVFDNIQRAADTTSSAKGSNRTEHLSQISKVLSQMAKDYNVNMVRILQPNRVGKGQIVSTDNVDGSSQIAKDCDCMITLHREKQGEMSVDQFAAIGHVDEGMSFSPVMLASVGLSRYSGGGRITLYYDGARSTVNEKPADEVEKLKKQAEAKAGSGHAQQLADLGIPTGKIYPMDESIIV